MLSRVTGGLVRRLRAACLRWQGVRLEGPCWVQSIEIPRNHFDIVLGRGVALDRGITLLATGGRITTPRIQIGRESYINRHTMIDASESVRIGSNCMIGPYCYITDHDHGMEPGVPVKSQPLVGAAVVIEDDVWIGAHVTILKGVRIGQGAIIGAGAVVTRSIASNEIAIGSPARSIGSRMTAKS